jgi:hypothetical protein
MLRQLVGDPRSDDEPWAEATRRATDPRHRKTSTATDTEH